MKNIYKLSFSSIIFCLLLIPVLLNAGEIPVNNGKTEVKFGKATYQSLSFTSSVSTVQFREILTPKGSFTEFYIQGCGFSITPGDPKLPVYKKLIEVPINGDYTIQVQNLSYKEYDLASFGITNKMIPAQMPLSKNITDPNSVPFIFNDATYQKNEWLGAPNVTVTKIGVERSVTLARLEVSPVQYNPVTNKIKVFENLEVKVIFNNADIDGTIQLKKNTWSPYFNSLYNILPNYQALPDALITSSPVTYVIVSSPLFHDALQPFIQWKKKKGFQVIEGYTNDPAVGTTTTSIKSWLTSLYNTPPAGFEKPSFVLFVGDVAQIPAFSTGGHPSDMYYCDYTNDHIPEVFYGRFSASNLTQLQPYIDKTLEYEQYTFPSDTFLGEVTMVAGADAAHQLTWGNGQINYGTTYYFNAAHNLLSHTYLQPEPAPLGGYSVSIRGDVSNGEAYSNYTAHGSEDGWADPQFSISQIAPLQNAHKYPLMVGNCCLTAKYSVNCFAEEITRAANKGAVGYIGCSDYSYWDEDYFWGTGFKAVVSNPVYNPQHLGAYDVTFHDQGFGTDKWFVTQGQMVQGGNMAVEESNSGMKLYYWETYNLMGDPSLMIYFSVPPAVAASYPSSTIIGTSVMQVTTEAYAYVALTVADTMLIAAQCADSTGIVNFSFSPLQTTDTVSVVITKQNRKPHIGYFTVIPASGPYVVLQSYTVNDSLGGNNNNHADFGENIGLDLTIKNIGVANSNSVTGIISTSDTNVLILANSCCFGPVPAGGTLTSLNAFNIKIRDNVADQHPVDFSLSISDGINTWTSNIRLTLNAPALTIGTLTILDPVPGGNNNGILDPGESAILKIVNKNSGHANAANTISRLTIAAASSPYIIVNNPSVYTGFLSPGASSDILFNVVTNGITPAGTVVDLTNTMTTGTLNQYTASGNFTSEIGQLPEYTMSSTTVNTCAGRFFDSGGETNNYGDNENYTMTFTSSTTGASVKAVFTQFDVEDETSCNYDWLKAYDGPNTTSTLLGKWCGTSTPPDLVGTSGSITFQFSSDYSENRAGWSVDLSCLGGALGISANAFPSDVCTGGSSQLVAIPVGGSANYTYLWTPSTYLDDPTSKTPVATPVTDISYTVTVNDGTNSITSGAVSLTVHPVPAAPTITLVSDILNSSVSTGNQWYLNGAMIPGATNPQLTPEASGEYYDVVTEGTCPSDPSNIITVVFTGVNNQVSQENVSVYPNPFRDSFTVSFGLSKTENVRIILTDGSGKECRRMNVKGTLGNNETLVSGAGLTPGLYYVTVTSGSYQVVKKLILAN